MLVWGFRRILILYDAPCAQHAFAQRCRRKETASWLRLPGCDVLHYDACLHTPFI